jgi:thermitase
MGIRRSTATVVAALASALALTAGGVAVADGASTAADPAAGPAGTPIARSVIVQWAPGTDHAERVAARQDAGVTYAAELGAPSFQLVETGAGESTAAVADALEADPAVAVAEPDGYRELEAIPNDPRFGEEWALQNTGQALNGLPAGKAGNDVDVLPAWERTMGSASVVVADIDSGYRADSPDLGPVEWTNPGEIPGNGIDDDHDGKVDDVHGWDFVGESISAPTEDADPTDSNLTSGGHGVHTAGIIGAAANNGIGIAGVAPGARIMPLRVCTNYPTTNETLCAISAIVAAINYAGEKGAKVANLSLGGTVFNRVEVNALAANPGTLYVIAAANDGVDNDNVEGHYPCDYRPATESVPVVPGAIENTICVAALDPSEALASYSDYGAASVDLGAPGTAVLSTFPKSETLYTESFEGNDFATKWTPFGAGFGSAGAGDGPLTSLGMTDTPGAPALASHTYGVKKTTGIAVPSGEGACRVEGRRYRKGGIVPGPGETNRGAPYGVIVNGTEYLEYFGGETSGSAMLPFRTVPIPGLGGKSVQPFFEYRASSAPAAGDGLWLDDIGLSCNSPLSTPPTYAFEDGTSMATPMVSGAAALLFSLDPAASVTQVRAAILGSTKPTASLAGKTVTGGRLDVAAAMNALVPLGGGGTPPGDGGTTTGGTLPSGLRAETEAALIKASPPATIAPPTPPAGCTVPKLAGKTLAQAKSALGAAKCKLGKVSSPKHGGGSLVVKSSTPAAGAKTAGTVAVKLAPKPKAKGRHH